MQGDTTNSLAGKQGSYRQIIKATALFGGTQIATMLISVVRSKVIAVLLGPGGMGIAGLITSSLKLIEGFSGFGLGTSAVKDVAAADASGDQGQVAGVLGVIRKLVWITGLLGSILTLILAPLLSQMAFGNHDYSNAFRWVSVTLLFNQVSVGQGVLLRGMRKLQFLARASLTGSIAGLLVSLPLYYFLRLQGIVPAIIASSILSLILTTYFSRKVRIVEARTRIKEALRHGQGMIRMGFMLSLSGMIALGASYVVRIYISSKGGVEEVGLFNAGLAIINTYVGMIFTAMATDYFPRLSGVAGNNAAARELINEQAEIVVLILAPVLILFLVFIDWIILVLYSSKFVAINDMIQWAALGIYFKSASFSIGYILLAKGDSKLFLWNELAANAYILVLNITGYTLAGLEGLGISFAGGYLLHFVQMLVVSQSKYDFHFNIAFKKIFLSQLLLGIACFIIIKISDSRLSEFIGVFLLVCSLMVSYTGIKKRIDIREALRNFSRRLVKPTQNNDNTN